MSDVKKAHCPTCDAERNCKVIGATRKLWDWEDRQGHSVSGGVDHTLFECLGCETVFYETDSWDSEDIEYWYDEDGGTQGEAIRTKRTYPKAATKTKPLWAGTVSETDPQLGDILNEMYVAYDNQSLILTAIGLRTALDRATEVLGIDPSLTFEEKLVALLDGGWIGATEKDILAVVTDAGNAAAHRAWCPEAKEVAQLLSALELFLQRAFIVGKGALNIKDSIPPKPRRQQAQEKDSSS